MCTLPTRPPAIDFTGNRHSCETDADTVRR
jgi:hypothetical protein